MAQAIVCQAPPPGPIQRGWRTPGWLPEGPWAARGGSSRSARAQACARCSGRTRRRAANRNAGATASKALRASLARMVWSDHRKVVSLIADSPFKPVPRRRAFEDVIVQVEEAIADGRIGPGDRLPPERELAGQLRVSRASVREALRVLEAFGVVTSRQGRGADAGSVVSAGDQNGLAGLLRIYSLLMKVPLSDLVDLRVADRVDDRARGRRAARRRPARRAGRRDGRRRGPRPLPGARHRLPRRAGPRVRQRARAAADGGAARDDRRATCAPRSARCATGPPPARGSPPTTRRWRRRSPPATPTRRSAPSRSTSEGSTRCCTATND